MAEKTYGASALYTLAIDAGWNKAQAVIAASIALAESGGRIDAVGGPNTNGTYDYGLWQINSVHGYDQKRLVSDPFYNAKAAHDIYKKQGWSAWAVWNEKKHEQYLDEVKRKSPGAADGNPLDPTTGLGWQGAEPLGKLGEPVEAAVKALGTLTDKDTWVKVAMVVGGGVALVLGVLILAGEFSQKIPTPVSQVTKGLLK